MKFFKNLSLKTKVSLFISSAFFLAFITIVFVISLKNVDVNNRALALQAKNQAGILLDVIDKNLFERNGDVKAFSTNPLIAELLNNDSLSDIHYSGVKGINDQLNKLIAYYECYDVMMICDKNGNVVFTNTKDRNGSDINLNQLKEENYANEIWFKHALKNKTKNYESEVVFNPKISKELENNGMGIEYSFPILNEYGEVVGVWYNFFNFNYVVDNLLNSIESDIKENQNINLTLVLTNNQGVVLSASNPSWYQNKMQLNVLNFNKGESIISEMSVNSDNFLVQKGDHKTDFYKNKWDVYAFIPKETISLSTFLDWYILGFFGLIVVFLVISNRLIKLIVDRILKVKMELLDLSKGNLLSEKEIEEEVNDEIKEMQIALLDLSEGLKEKQEFAKAIGQGDFTINFDLKYENDNLGKSLIEMKNNLLEVSIRDKKQSWVTEGLAKFVEILRSNSDDNSVLYDRIIQNLVKYVKANQGGLFVVTKDNDGKEFFELVGCYAWDRKKYLHMKIEKGEGLVGQCWIEGEMVLLTEVPENYVRISSGLGVANPKAILIMPLKLNDEVFGAIELASFNSFQEHEVQFIEKLSESIASTISAEKINENTKKLLEESKKQQAEMEQQTEEMRAQEEEMRQNMEEMQATQEEMEKAQSALSEMMQDSISLKEAVDESLGVIEFDLKGTIVHANQNFLNVVGYSLNEIKGKHHSIFVDDDFAKSEDYKKFWNDLASGKNNNGIHLRKNSKGEKVWLNAIYKVYKDQTGKPYKVIKFCSDVTKVQENEIEYKAQLSIINSVAIVSKTDLQGNITYVNDEFVKWSKYSKEELIGQNHRILKSGDQDDAIFIEMWKTISSGKIFRGEIKNKAKDGSFYWVDAIIAPVLGLNGKPIEYIAQRFVINDKVELKERIVDLENKIK
jgi:PAS domain S-box-containing protein